MRLILLGCPGAGKGTQAKHISVHYHIPHISTGDILRAAIQSGNELGLKVKKIVADGFLVPDSLVIDLVNDRLQQSDCIPGFLLDGFPRTIAQAQALGDMSSIDYVIDIDVPEDDIVKRLSGRRIHPGSGRTYHVIYQPPQQEGLDDATGEPLIQREDDQESAIRKRLAVYYAETSPLREYYQKQAHVKYIKINGAKPVQEIQKELFELLDS